MSRQNTPGMTKKSKGRSQVPLFTFSDPFLDTKKFIKETRDQITKIAKHWEFQNNVIVAVILIGFLVLVFTVVGLAFQAWQFGFASQRESVQLSNQETLIKNTVEQEKEMIDSQKKIIEDLKNIQDSLKTLNKTGISRQ